MKKFTVSEATMLLNDGSKVKQVFNCSSIYLEDFIQRILNVCSKDESRVGLRVTGWYSSVGFTIEIFFQLETDDDVQIIFDRSVCVDVDDCTERNFHANEWYDIGYTFVQEKNRGAAGFRSDLYKGEGVKEYNEDKEDAMKKFTVSKAKMLLENGDKLNQVFNCSSYTYLDDFVQYILGTCTQTENRKRLRVRGWYDGIGFTLEIFFPLRRDEDVRIMFDSDVHVNVDDCTGDVFYAGKWYDIGYTSARGKDRSTAGFGSDLYKDKEPVEVNEDKEDKEDIRSYNVGASDYAQHKIQPWDIYLDYDLNPWDADIVKRVLRTKKTDTRIMDYEKIIHICKERIRQIDEYGK